jgi:hypothetical protein
LSPVLASDENSPPAVLVDSSLAVSKVWLLLRARRFQPETDGTQNADTFDDIPAAGQDEDEALGTALHLGDTGWKRSRARLHGPHKASRFGHGSVNGSVHSEQQALSGQHLTAIVDYVLEATARGTRGPALSILSRARTIARKRGSVNRRPGIPLRPLRVSRLSGSRCSPSCLVMLPATRYKRGSALLA